MQEQTFEYDNTRQSEATVRANGHFAHITTHNYGAESVTNYLSSRHDRLVKTEN